MSSRYSLHNFLQRDHSFELLSNPRTASARINDIILVHGFSGRAFSEYRLSLEELIVSTVGSKFQDAAIRVFRFDFGRLLSGAPDSFSSEVQKLRRHLLHLYEDGLDQDKPASSRNDSDSLHGEPGTPESMDTPLKVLVFIVHGLGSWIVKDVLASRSSRNIGFMPLGIIHLDCPKRTLDTASKPDSDYLRRFFATFNPSHNLENDRDKEKLRRLQNSLGHANSRFQRHGVHYRDQRRKRNFPLEKREIYQEKRLLWISDAQSVPRAIASGWGQWIWSFWYSETVTLLMKELPELPDLVGAAFTHATSRDAYEESVDSSDDGGSVAVAGYENNIPPGHRVQSWNTDQDEVDHDNNESPTVIFSTFTAPDLGVSEDNELKNLIHLANSFFQRCDLGNAERLYVSCKEKLPNPDQPTIKHVQIHMRIMAVRMYLGKYNEAADDLKNIKESINISAIDDDTQGKMRKELHRDRRRWHAKLLMRNGNWSQAARKYERLLKEDPQDENGRTQRDLALIYADLGYYDQAYATIQLAEKTTAVKHVLTSDIDVAKDTDANITTDLELHTQDRVAASHSSDATTKIKSMAEVGIQSAIAEIHMLSGSYVEALETSTNAYHKLTSMIGKEHLKSLYLANIKAWCLALNMEYTAAEALCLSTLEIITRTLGRKHPLCLEATRLLVYVFRSQSRFAEAIGTAKSLYSLAGRQLGETHPLTIRSKYQLAAAYLANGDYSEALTTLKELIKHAKNPNSLGYFHPESLKFRSALAHALLCCGRLYDARRLALETLIHQIHVYKHQNVISGGVDDLRGLIVCDKESCKPDNYYQFVLKRLHHDTNPDKLSFCMHSYWVSTLETIARIECKSHRDGASDSELLAVESLLRIIDGLLPDTESIQFAFAQVLQEPTSADEDNRLDEAITLLEKVESRRKKTLGKNHLDTLCANREMMIARCMRSVSGMSRDEAPDNLMSVIQSRSLEIVDSLEATLGVYHPESLRSRIWYITVQLLNSGNDCTEVKDSDQDIHDVLREVVARLRTSFVRKERLIESLEMEKTVAGLLLGSGCPGEELCDILRGTLKAIRHATTDLEIMDVQPKLEELENDIEGMLKKAEQTTT
ncbi:hypothetical protein PFICI_04881 [Pestalotiopsis fici W106-1]|uniref:MalT-like TPR region domain-containing protein n=1 Tax=Pestalotiopsis fici (strain W106-1 / CGMCC3.15140) TaxID=1229662 RepID=W3XAC0_PESFW|nr:uncharacterized protein PFICI_04881 [Pestalotiopsis fici W106-1]ETS83005.1 hypothetical protein PFICI_04881 [Pestalotiopsis fici W106-1]